MEKVIEEDLKGYLEKLKAEDLKSGGDGSGSSLAPIEGSGKPGEKPTGSPRRTPLKESSDADRTAFQYPATKASVAKAKSAADFLGGLPADERRNFILMIDSESAQDATCEAPRVLMPGSDSTTIYAFGTKKEKDGSYTDSGVEVVQFEAGKAKFHNHLMTWAKEGTGPGTVEENPASCTSCHSNSRRPNWDTYDNWAYTVPFNRDRFYENSEEAKYLKRFWGKIAPNDDRLKTLVPPPGIKRTLTSAKGAKPETYSVEFEWNGEDEVKEAEVGGKKVKRGGKFFTMQHPKKGGSDEGQGVALFDNLTEINAKRVARQIADNPQVKDFRHALIGFLKGCEPEKKPGGGDADKDPFAFLGKDAREVLRKANSIPDFPTFQAKVEKGQQAFAEKKLARIKDSLQRLVRCNAEAEGKTLSKEEVAERANLELHRRPPGGFKMFNGELVDRESYGQGKSIAAFAYLLGPFGVPTTTWSLSAADLRKLRTYADLFNTYSTEIRSVMSDKFPDDYKMSCEDLAKNAETTLGKSVPGGEAPNTDAPEKKSH